MTDADATFTLLFEDGDDPALSDHAAVADGYLLGTEAVASFDFADDNEVRKIGYIGPRVPFHVKHYERISCFLLQVNERYAFNNSPKSRRSPMLLAVDRIRYRLISARKAFAHDGARRGQELSALLAAAMTEERRMSGAATERDLESRYGFTADEIAGHARRALDIATQRFVRGGVPDPATA